MLQNSGGSAEWELALPVWSVQLRLVPQSQTCWAGSQEGRLLGLKADGSGRATICSVGSRCPSAWRLCGLFGTGVKGLWVLRGPQDSGWATSSYLFVKMAKDT